MALCVFRNCIKVLYSEVFKQRQPYKQQFSGYVSSLYSPEAGSTINYRFSEITHVNSNFVWAYAQNFFEVGIKFERCMNLEILLWANCSKNLSYTK